MAYLLQKIVNQDIKLFYFLNRRIKCRLLDWLMPLVTHLGGAIFTIAFGGLLFFLGEQNLKQVGSEIILSVLISGTVVQVIKRIINRNRPYKILKEVNLTKASFRNYSFPSGHTTAIFSLAVTVGFNFPNFILISQSLAVLVGLSRAYLGVHYPSDIVSGAAIGIYFSNLIHGAI
ncbi:membrane-associated phospholipid phosphatase [Halobacteroides halobius DSM 5150]|uniref:Membrane-associated phospholipid phosphatase n=1 Tax=Halobacteroides halobius (strain ATCC 35273 / DSM 5150 / MD-1) TaxID=748449 RepID=L0KAV8_HALHC|nr:phosphatase PAP2 family protein [Halobacteroides halobius]AGB42427.1 membrane-associated phospholipid phosphatase [Halobacteroides halobius DSM 5150]